MSEIDDLCYAGYRDGLDPDSPEPGENQHPAYAHGFMNGRDDLRGQPRKPAAALRGDFQKISAAAAM